MIKQFTMYVPLVGDTNIVPCTYVHIIGNTYKNIETNNPFYINENTINDFINKGFIYDVVK